MYRIIWRWYAWWIWEDFFDKEIMSYESMKVIHQGSKLHHCTLIYSFHSIRRISFFMIKNRGKKFLTPSKLLEKKLFLFSIPFKLAMVVLFSWDSEKVACTLDSCLTLLLFDLSAAVVVNSNSRKLEKKW